MNPSIKTHDINIPDELVARWQKLVNIMAEINQVPAALIMKVEPPYIEVFRSSASSDNPYKVGEREHLAGLYCERVITTGDRLLVPNALQDPDWDKNPDIELGMISYLGFPLLWPDDQVFGTICVLDSEENRYSEAQAELLLQFKDLIEAHLGLLYQGYELERTVAERKRAEEVLRESEERFHRLSEASIEGIAIHEKGEILEANQQYAEMFGYELSEVIGMHALDFAAPESRDLVLKNILSGYEEPYEAIGLRKDGSTFPGELAGKSIPYQGRTARVTAIRDITERVRADEALRRYTERLEILHEIDQAIVEARSPKAIARAVLHHIRQLVPCQRASVVLFAFEAHEATTLAVDAAGEIKFGEGACVPLEPYRDIMEVLRQGKVHEIDDLLALSQPPPAVQSLQAEGIRSAICLPLIVRGELIGALNLGAEEPGAFGEEQIKIAREVADPLAIAIQQTGLYEQVQRHAEELEQRVAERTAELGERITEVEQLNRALTNLLEDLQQANRLTAETAHRLAETNAELEAFTYSVSHDLRAPLRAMQGYADVLLADYEDALDATGQHYAQRIVRAAQHMDTLIQDLLAYSRLTRAEIRLNRVSLEHVVEAAMAQLEAEIGTRGAQVTVAKPLPDVTGHFSTLVQVVCNLVSNAVRFVDCEVQPQVRVWAEMSRGAEGQGGQGAGEPGSRGDLRPRPVPSLSRASGQGAENVSQDAVRLWVEDNGIGIDPEHQERIFHVFERLHGIESYPGTGIGLAIVRKGIERMGGRVGVESHPGEGSRFWVELEKA